MTEDDTYEALLRIPRRELENGKADHICVTIRYNEHLRREDEERNSKEYKTWKRWNRFAFMGFNYPMITLKLAMDESHMELLATSAFEGTGWTYKSYLAEINKDLDREDRYNEKIKSKRMWFMILSIIVLFPFIWFVISLVPWMLFKPFVGMALGIVLGQGLAIISDIFIS